MTVPADVGEAVEEAKAAIGRLVGERPVAALRALDDLGRWTTHIRQRVETPSSQASSVDRMRRRLDASVEHRSGRVLGL